MKKKAKARRSSEMKILHLVDSFDERYERDQIQIVRSCRRRGYDTTVVTTNLDSDGNTVPRDYFRASDGALKPVCIIRPKSFKLTLPWLNPLLVYLPHRHCLDTYDLLHAYTVGSYSSFIGNFVSRVKHTPLVMRAEMSATLFDRLRANPALRKVALRLLNGADAIYSFTVGEKNRLVKLRIPEDKISVIPVGIDWHKFSRIRKAGGDITIGYLGRFIPFKGVHRLVQPLSRLMTESPNIKVIFAGPKTDATYADNIINSLKPFTNFTYLEDVSSEYFYQLCDIVLAPSLPFGRETGSITTLEAMATRKVVIASDTCPMNEYIEHGISGMLVSEDREIYQYCKELIKHPALIREIGMKACQRARCFNWDDIFARLEEVYTALVQ